MANLLPPPCPHFPAPVRHTSYASYYSDPTSDPYQGDYSRLFERLDPELNNVASHVILLEQAIAPSPHSLAYLCCATQGTQVQVYCVHQLPRYTGSLDGRETTWDGCSFAFLGDTTEGLVTTVELPATCFQAVMNVRAKTADYIVTHLDELTGRGMPPSDPDD